MNTINRHRHDMLVRVKRFGDEHGDLFPGDGTGGRAFAALAAAVGALGASLVSQAQGEGVARLGTLSKAAARDKLLAALNEITRTARAMSADVTGLQGQFLPYGGRNDLDLVTTARKFALDAQPFAAQFTAHGLPATFLADLQSALDAFMTAVQTRLASRDTQSQARSAIAGAFDAAFAALDRLDAIVPNTLRSQATLLAAWNSARRVDKVRRSRGRTSSGPTPAKPGQPGPASQPVTAASSAAAPSPAVSTSHV